MRCRLLKFACWKPKISRAASANLLFPRLRPRFATPFSRPPASASAACRFARRISPEPNLKLKRQSYLNCLSAQAAEECFVRYSERSEESPVFATEAKRDSSRKIVAQNDGIIL